MVLASDVTAGAAAPAWSWLGRFRRAAAGSLAQLALAVGFLVAFVVGLVGLYHYRRFQRCEQAMDPLLSVRATQPEVGRQLGARPYASYSPADRDSLMRLAGGWNQKLDRIRNEAGASSIVSVYLVGDIVHFAFFDSSSRLRAYACVGN